MARIVNKNDIKTYKVAYQMRQENRFVLTVIIGIEDTLLTEKVTVITPYRLVIGIEETFLIRITTVQIRLALYPPVKLLHSLQRCKSFQFLPHTRIYLIGQPFLQRRVSIVSPTCHEVVVGIGARIGVIEINTVLVRLNGKAEIRITQRCDGTLVDGAVGKVLTGRHLQREWALLGELSLTNVQCLCILDIIKQIVPLAFHIVARFTEHAIPTGYNHVECIAIVCIAHLIARLRIEESKDKRCLVGMIAIELIGQRKQHLIISPVGEIMSLALFKAVVQHIIELRFLELDQLVSNLITT